MPRPRAKCKRYCVQTEHQTLPELQSVAQNRPYKDSQDPKQERNNTQTLIDRESEAKHDKGDEKNTDSIGEAWTMALLKQGKGLPVDSQPKARTNELICLQYIAYPTVAIKDKHFEDFSGIILRTT